MRKLIIAAIIAACVAICGASFAEQDPIVGIWYRFLPASGEGYVISFLMFREDGSVYAGSLFESISGPGADAMSRYGSWGAADGEYYIEHANSWGRLTRDTVYLCGPVLYSDYISAQYDPFMRILVDASYPSVPSFRIEQFVHSLGY